MAKALQITARPEKGFRRAGVHHPASPVVHPPGTFDDKQVAALKAEPKLVVAEADWKEPKADEAEGSKGKSK